MANTFTFIGKIALGKESEKFKPIDRREFSSGWMNTTVKFNCISGTNRVLCMTQGGKWKQDSKNIIKTLGKNGTDANGMAVKGEKIDIPWAKRFDEDQIEKVAGFRKFVVDTRDYPTYNKLKSLVEAFEDGSNTDELVEELGIDNLEDAKEAFDKMHAKRKVFLSEWDFAEYMTKVAKSEKLKDKLFKISGNYEIQYNADKDTFYTNYHVNRVVPAAEDAAPQTELKVDFFYGEDAWDESMYDETGRCTINGWLSYYDNNLKKTGFKEFSVVVREENDKTRNGLKRKFVVDDEEIKQIGLTLSVIEGTEVVEITMDMLDEETQEDIECGLLDFEEVKRELGGRAIGDRISEIRFTELTPKKNKPEDTTYTIEDMCAAKADEVELEDDDEEDIFDIENDDDL